MLGSFKVSVRKARKYVRCSSRVPLKPTVFDGLDDPKIGALIMRIGLGAPFYYSYKKEPPKIVLVII